MWDPDILRSMWRHKLKNKKSPRIQVEDACVLLETPPKASCSAKGWLDRAQSLMVDLEHTDAINSFVGYMWGAAKRQANESESFMKDPTSIQLARAFKNGLKMMKHGGKLKIGETIRPFLLSSHWNLCDDPTRLSLHKKKNKAHL